MGKFRKKPVVVEAITFQELVEHGKKVAPDDAKEHGGFAWSFDYKGHPITHENNECYLIPTLEGIHNMTPKDMLITGVKGEIYPCKIDIFEKTYEAEELETKKCIAVIAKSIEDFNSWADDNKVIGKRKSLMILVSKEADYHGVTNPSNLISCSFHDVTETDNAKENPFYGDIMDCIKGQIVTIINHVDLGNGVKGWVKKLPLMDGSIPETNLKDHLTMVPSHEYQGIKKATVTQEVIDNYLASKVIPEAYYPVSYLAPSQSPTKEKVEGLHKLQGWELTENQIQELERSGFLGMLIKPTLLTIDKDIDSEEFKEIWDKFQQAPIYIVASELSQVNQSIQNLPESQREQVSDGYHTFKELYDHRIRLWITLCMVIADLNNPKDNPVWITTVHSDGSSWDGWFLLGLGKKKGQQITYHLPNSYWNECTRFATILDKAPEFDGHTSADVLERLKELI
ncbi:MAG: hypothetical protein VYB44_07200 [Bacteroidota bacterium]|nr:hypothetical protein [Bacteroidota bacterium]